MKHGSKTMWVCLRGAVCFPIVASLFAQLHAASIEKEDKTFESILVLREKRKAYVPGECSPTWRKEFLAWARQHDWFASPSPVLEFTDAKGYRHPLGVGYGQADDPFGKDEAEMTASGNLLYLIGNVQTQKVGRTSVSMSVHGTMTGVGRLYKVDEAEGDRRRTVVVVGQMMRTVTDKAVTPDNTQIPFKRD